MRVLYLHLPRFPVQRRVLEQPSLERKPFVLVRETSGQRLVMFASSAALRVGVRPGQTSTAAQALLPGLTNLPYCAEAEAHALLTLGEALLVLGPSFALSPPDGLWLDASAAHLFGGEAALRARVLQMLTELGYLAHAVVASQLFAARALARLCDQISGRVSILEQGQEAQMLASLPVMAADMCDAAVLDRLHAFGLETLGQVAQIPEDVFVDRFGAAGRTLHRLARGHDEALLVPTPLQETFEESLELGFPAESMQPLMFALKTILDRLCARLRGRRKMLVRLRLVLRLDPRGERTITLALARPSNEVRLLLELVRIQLESVSVPSPIAAVVAVVQESCPYVEEQLALGDEPQGDAPLEAVLSRLATSLGAGALCSLQVPEVFRPDAASVQRPFRPARRRSSFGEPGVLSQVVAAKPDPKPHHLERPARILDEPELITVLLGSGGEPLEAIVFGKHRTVLAIAGPEKVSGTWWGAQKQPSREFFRVFLEGLGPVWIFRDLEDGRFYLVGLFD